MHRQRRAHRGEPGRDRKTDPSPRLTPVMTAVLPDNGSDMVPNVPPDADVPARRLGPRRAALGISGNAGRPDRVFRLVESEAVTVHQAGATVAPPPQEAPMTSPARQPTTTAGRHRHRGAGRDRRRQARRAAARAPAGRAGVETVAIDTRTREEIESTHRAGILEADAARTLVETGVSDRILREGDEHAGIELRFGVEHRIDFRTWSGVGLALPADRRFVDLADARDRDGGHRPLRDPRHRVLDVESDRPRMRWTGPDGTRHEVRARYVGAPTGRAASAASWCRLTTAPSTPGVPLRLVRDHGRAPKSAPELVYAH